ncbi:hypothetical protein LX36DRAFT_58082 [Colletotrichum falcatum]|nr:hypothetical protein LX36DRAFT_58082 [Colletotrichum falcatum]
MPMFVFTTEMFMIADDLSEGQSPITLERNLPIYRIELPLHACREHILLTHPGLDNQAQPTARDAQLPQRYRLAVKRHCLSCLLQIESKGGKKRGIIGRQKNTQMHPRYVRMCSIEPQANPIHTNSVKNRKIERDETRTRAGCPTRKQMLS